MKRIRLRQSIERYPHFVAPRNAEGTVLVHDSFTLTIRLDEPVAGLEDWDNELVFVFPEDEAEVSKAIEFLTYTTRGNVRGSCGHQHKTIEAASRCQYRDQKGCKRQGGYSDRGIVRSDGVPLTEAEYAAANDAYDRLRFSP